MSDYASRLSEVGGRFHRYFRAKGLSGREVSQKMGIHQSKLSTLVNGGDFNLSAIYQIITAFPALNIEWLFTGKGVPEPDIEQRFQIETLLADLDGKLQAHCREPAPKLDRQAKEKVEELSVLLDEAIRIRALLLARIADEKSDLFHVEADE